MTEPTDRDREMACTVVMALASAREEGRREERDRVLKHAKTRATKIGEGGIECVPLSELYGIDAAVVAERERCAEAVRKWGDMGSYAETRLGRKSG